MFQAIDDRAQESPRRWVRFAAYLMRLAMQVVRQWARDRCPQQAASLAFQTVLSVVPILAVCLAVFRATGTLEAESALVTFVTQQLIAVKPEVFAAELRAYTENVTFQTLGLVGLVTTIILAFIMFNNLERVLNQIYRVERKRPLTQKFTVFYASATIGPLLIGLSLYYAAQVGLTRGFAGFLFSFLTSFLAVFLAIVFLPAMKVRLGPAAIGALLTTALFEVAKFGFKYYVTEFAFAKYSGIYGALAVFPLLMIWIYWSWLMLLLGVEVAHAAQNITYLEQMDRRKPMSLENEILRRVNGPVAARLMVAVCEAYVRGDKVLSKRVIADRLDLSDEVLERIADRLKDANLLMEMDGDQVGLVPARPPSEITLQDVLAAFRSDDQERLSSRGTTPLEEILRDLEADASAKTGNVTLADLVRVG